MGFFDKKYCDICEAKIGLLGNKKLEDGNMCKGCAELLSPYIEDRRHKTLEEIQEHLAYRLENEAEVDAFNVTRTLGGYYKVLLDEDTGKFIVTGDNNWQSGNPDVIPFSQVTGCQIDVRESRNELKFTDKDGNDVSFNPRQYDIDYDFYITIHVNSPWFNEINFQINNRRIDNYGSAEYRDMEQQANEIKAVLTEARQGTRESAVAANAPKTAKLCPFCGATTMPDERGCCEFCGGAMQ